MVFDTRSKIVTRADVAPAGGTLHLAQGWFDVLTSDHCRRLGEAKPASGSLGVLVLRESAARPVALTAEDRAQLVAALACVDWVLICEASEVASVAAALGPSSLLNVESGLRRNVIRDVLDLHRKV